MFLSKVIRTAFAIDETNAIVVRSRSSTCVCRFCQRTRLVRLRVRLEDLTRYYLSAACLDRLAACIRVGRLRTVLRFFLFRRVGYLRRLAKDRSRLTNVTSTFFPLSTAEKDWFSTSAGVQACVRLLNRLNGRSGLIRLFCRRRGAFARFLHRRDRFGMTFVLVTITSGR